MGAKTFFPVLKFICKQVKDMMNALLGGIDSSHCGCFMLLCCKIALESYTAVQDFPGFCMLEEPAFEASP